MAESKPAITKDILIADLVESYPEVMEPLQIDYGFYCIHCIMSGFETLEEGAKVHGVEGLELDEMVEYLRELVRKVKQSSL